MEKIKDYRVQIEAFEKSSKNIAIAYGGDGEVLNVVRRTEGKKAIIPFRNYGLCDKHLDRLDDFFAENPKNTKGLKLTRCPFIEWHELTIDGKEANVSYGQPLSGRGIAEVAFKGVDITKALRFNVYVDHKLYLKNVICDAGIVSTRYGSTGYFKSASRCIFNCDGIGVAFVAPTQGISNLVLKNTSTIEFEFLREAEIVVSADTSTRKTTVDKGSRIEVREIPDAVSIFGLEEFHCFECRQKRHSIIEAGVPIQDQYIIL